MKAIMESLKWKSGTGKKLRRLHDCLVQHLRALKTMGYEPSASVITSLILLKLDQNTRFEWQKYTKKIKSVPHYDDMLTFLDMRAQASEMLVRRTDPNEYQGMQFQKPCQLKTSLLTDTSEICVVYKAANTLCTLVASLGLLLIKICPRP